MPDRSALGGTADLPSLPSSAQFSVVCCPLCSLSIRQSASTMAFSLESTLRSLARKESVNNAGAARAGCEWGLILVSVLT